MSRVDWTQFKNFVDNRKVPIHEKELDDGNYLLQTFDGPIKRSCKIKADTADHTDYTDNYQSSANPTYTDDNGLPRSRIEEENIKTGGHYQAASWKLTLSVGESTEELDITFPIPVSVLAAEWSNSEVLVGDSVEVCVAPDTMTGVITSAVSTSTTVIPVSQTVVDNARLGYYAKLDDGTNADDLGRIVAIDKAGLTVTVETATVNAFAVNTSFKQTIKLLNKSPLPDTGRVQIGQSKIGGSYLPTGTVIRIKYYNDSNTAKDFVFWMEYLY